MAERVAIVGAGLAGCLLATLLGRRGIEVTVYERREDPRRTGPERGRSINLAVSARGLDALERVGLREESLGRALPMHGRMVHGVQSRPSFRPYSADGKQAINSISRSELNETLLDVAERTPGVTLQFGHRLRDVNLDTGQLSFETSDGRRRRPHADIVLASDGSYSAARRAVTFRQDFTFSQDYLERGLQGADDPRARGGLRARPGRAAHLAARRVDDDRAAEPGPDLHLHAVLAEGVTSRLLQTDAQIREYFAHNYPDAFELMPSLADDYRNNPVGSLVTVRCWPWVHAGERVRLALVGDAAHAIVPVLRAGRELRARGLRGDRRAAWASSAATGPGRWPSTSSGARPTATRSPTWRWTTSSRCATGSTRRCSVRRPLRSTHSSGRCPASTCRATSWCRSRRMPYAQIPARMRRQNQATALTATMAAGLVAGGLAVRRARRR